MPLGRPKPGRRVPRITITPPDILAPIPSPSDRQPRLLRRRPHSLSSPISRLASISLAPRAASAVTISCNTGSVVGLPKQDPVFLSPITARDRRDTYRAALGMFVWQSVKSDAVETHSAEEARSLEKDCVVGEIPEQQRKKSEPAHKQKVGVLMRSQNPENLKGDGGSAVNSKNTVFGPGSRRGAKWIYRWARRLNTTERTNATKLKKRQRSGGPRLLDLES